MQTSSFTHFTFYPGFTQLPRVKLGKTVRRFYPPTLVTMHTNSVSKQHAWNYFTQTQTIPSWFWGVPVGPDRPCWSQPEHKP